jgi:sulfur reductase FeS subunit
MGGAHNRGAWRALARYGMVMDTNTCVGCDGCIAACTQEHQTPFWAGKFRTHVEDVYSGTFPDVKRYFLPRLCMQCEDAPCVSVCPTGASHYVPGGVVEVDQDTCIVCKACIPACPYDARYVYSADDVRQAATQFIAEGEIRQHAAHVDKCNFCYTRLEKGLKPACAATCPGEARIFGDLDDPSSRVSQLVASGAARPVGEEYGTRPKVFYIPPK